MSMQKDDDEITDELPEAKLIILSPSEVSKLLHKSLRWVYHHAPELGASRIGGSWIFTEEGLNDALQRARRMEGGSPGQGTKKTSLVSIEAGGRTLGRRNKKRAQGIHPYDPFGITQPIREKPHKKRAQKPEADDRHGIEKFMQGLP
jgi:hypothetical protein